MTRAPLHIVDTMSAAPEDAAKLSALLRDRLAPIMLEAGAQLLELRATSPDLGEDVLVQIVWGATDHADWNVIRRKCFLDARWYNAWAEANRMRHSGTRRFYYPTPRSGGEGGRA